MDLKKIERLMELMQSHGLSEIEVVQGSDIIKLRKPGAGTAEMAPIVTPPQFRVATGAEPLSKSAAATQKASGNVVRSPLVGTFYRAPSPGADPFVRVGQRVKKGDTLCIVEAMKLMNEIKAETDGVIAEILIENEQPVEFDQPLFVLE